MKPRILRQDRVGEQLSPSSGTGIHCQGLHQNHAAFLYDNWHPHGIKGKLVSKHGEHESDSRMELSLVFSRHLRKPVLKV